MPLLRGGSVWLAREVIFDTGILRLTWQCYCAAFPRNSAGGSRSWDPDFFDLDRAVLA